MQSPAAIATDQIATRRTRTAGKVEVPNVEDHVSKLEHMGKETVRKLKDIRMAAEQAGIDINIHINSFPNSVNKGQPTVLSSLLSEPHGPPRVCLLCLSLANLSPHSLCPQLE